MYCCKKNKAVVPINSCLICGEDIEKNTINIICIQCKGLFHTECEQFYFTYKDHNNKKCPNCKQSDTLVKMIK